MENINHKGDCKKCRKQNYCKKQCRANKQFKVMQAFMLYTKMKQADNAEKFGNDLIDAKEDDANV